MKYEFTVFLEGGSELDVEMAERLFEAGCDDASPGSSNGAVLVDFRRQAPTLEAAIQSAVANIQAAGYSPGHVELAAEEFATAV
jgi:hypothetical protein